MNFMKAVSDRLRQAAPAKAAGNRNLVRDLKAFVPAERSPIDGAELSEGGRELMKVLRSQDELLDSILREQDKMHRDVKQRKWDSLQKSMSQMRELSDSFVALDRRREALVGNDRGMYFEPGVEPVFSSVRSKLTRSKIENEALRSYVNATKDFISGIIDECYAGSGVCYGQNGRMVNSEVGSVLINTEF